MGQDLMKRIPRLKVYLNGRQVHRVVAARRSRAFGDRYGFVTVLAPHNPMFGWNSHKEVTYYGLVRFVDPETVDLAEVYLK